MSKAPASDLFATLRTYVAKLSEGERSPAEVASAVNHWARESADALKSKIHEEVEAAVLKMGFVKREEFDELVAKVAAMNSQKATTKKTAVKKSAPKRAAAKPTSEKSKKATVKKSVAKKTSVKK